MQEKQTTNDDILHAISEFADHVEKRFQKIDQRFEGIDGRLDGIDGRLGRVESTMVTKDDLTDKLADTKGDIISITRKEDKKVGALVFKMREKQLLTDEEANEILSMEPFPDLRAVHARESR